MNVEFLIELLRERAHLYDPRHRYYRDGQMARNAWEAIGKEIGISGECDSSLGL